MRTTRLAVAVLTIAPAAALPAQIPKALIEHTPVVATTSDAGTLDEVWPHRRTFGPYPWVRPEVYRAADRPTTYYDRK